MTPPDGERVFGAIRRVAKRDWRIQAVLLNGSRANLAIAPDRYQDYDLIFVVDDLKSFAGDQEWVRVFGTPLLIQRPYEMEVPPIENDPDRITYLVLFEDFVRMDITLIERESLDGHLDSLATVLYDPDDSIPELPPPSDEDYRTKAPTAKSFRDCCNEFWWVSTYVVKGLARGETLYAKHTLEKPLRDMLLLMLAWRYGHEHDFRINFGAEYRYLAGYMDETTRRQFGKTYPKFDAEEIQLSLSTMMALFEESSNFLAGKMNFAIDREEPLAARRYFRELLTTRR